MGITSTHEIISPIRTTRACSYLRFPDTACHGILEGLWLLINLPCSRMVLRVPRIAVGVKRVEVNSRDPTFYIYGGSSNLIFVVCFGVRYFSVRKEVSFSRCMK
jgi:hypothetical protein